MLKVCSSVAQLQRTNGAGGINCFSRRDHLQEFCDTKVLTI